MIVVVEGFLLFLVIKIFLLIFEFFFVFEVNRFIAYFLRF